jgi:hypothetical protein
VLVPRPISSRITSERRVASRRIAAVSRISTMKVLSPRATLSLAPTRERMRSTTPTCAALRGHVAAELGEDHDQRDLAHQRGFAGHVGARDEPQPLAREVEHRVVGHEGAGRGEALDHGVAAVDDRDAARSP